MSWLSHCRYNKLSFGWNDLHHKFNMQRINNENCVKFVHSKVCTYYTWISCVENTFDTWIKMLTNEIGTYEWTNVTWILHRPINLCVKYVFNAKYQCVKCTNYEWTNFARFSLLNCEMLSLWCKCNFGLKFQ
jgi:hypothetical protein